MPFTPEPEPFSRDDGVQTDPMPLIDTDENQNNDPDDTCRLLYDTEPPPYLISFERDNFQLNAALQSEENNQRGLHESGASSNPQLHDADETTRLLCDTDEQTASVCYGTNRVNINAPDTDSVVI